MKQFIGLINPLIKAVILIIDLYIIIMMGASLSVANDGLSLGQINNITKLFYIAGTLAVLLLIAQMVILFVDEPRILNVVLSIDLTIVTLICWIAFPMAWNLYVGILASIGLTLTAKYNVLDTSYPTNPENIISNQKDHNN